MAAGLFDFRSETRALRQGRPEVVVLQPALWTLENGREEKSLQQAERVLRNIVYAVTFIDAVHPGAAATHTAAVGRKCTMERMHPTMERYDLRCATPAPVHRTIQ